MDAIDRCLQHGSLRFAAAPASRHGIARGRAVADPYRMPGPTAWPDCVSPLRLSGSASAARAAETRRSARPVHPQSTRTLSILTAFLPISTQPEFLRLSGS